MAISSKQQIGVGLRGLTNGFYRMQYALLGALVLSLFQEGEEGTGDIQLIYIVPCSFLEAAFKMQVFIHFGA